MAAPKRATHVVEHKRLYLSVEGKLTHFPKGKTLTLTAKQAQKLDNRVKSLKDDDTTDLTTSGEDQAKAEAAERLKALKARAAELNLEGSAKWNEKRLVEEIKKAEDAIAAGNAAAGQE